MATSEDCAARVGREDSDDGDDDEGDAMDQDKVPNDDVDDHVGGDDTIGEKPELRPQSKEDLQKLRERFENTMGLVSHLYHDLDLKDQFYMVYIASQPYMTEYSNMLVCQKKSQDWCQILVTSSYDYSRTSSWIGWTIQYKVWNNNSSYLYFYYIIKFKQIAS